MKTYEWMWWKGWVQIRGDRDTGTAHYDGRGSELSGFIWMHEGRVVNGIWLVQIALWSGRSGWLGKSGSASSRHYDLWNKVIVDTEGGEHVMGPEIFSKRDLLGDENDKV